MYAERFNKHVPSPVTIVKLKEDNEKSKLKYFVSACESPELFSFAAQVWRHVWSCQAKLAVKDAVMKTPACP